MRKSITWGAPAAFLRTIAVAALGVGLCLAPRPGIAGDRSVFYTTAAGGGGNEILAIKVHGTHVTTKDVGPTGLPGGAAFDGCFTLAMSKWGTLYSVCGPLFGAQQLATIDLKTGHANVFGVPTPGLAVMSIAFGPDGKLYAVGDCNPDFSNPAVPACVQGSDPNFNSFYTIDVSTGAFSRIGATGAPQYFMDLAFDRHGHLFGVTTTLAPSYVPAILYRLDPATGVATKVVDLIGSSQVMGLAFDDDGKLYGTDFMAIPGVYVIDMKTGFETAIGSLPIGLSSSLELIKGDDDDDR
jgi:DNA-binding beta-propeller fold protein YncE